MGRKLYRRNFLLVLLGLVATAPVARAAALGVEASPLARVGQRLLATLEQADLDVVLKTARGLGALENLGDWSAVIAHEHRNNTTVRVEGFSLAVTEAAFAVQAAWASSGQDF